MTSREQNYAEDRISDLLFCIAWAVLELRHAPGQLGSAILRGS